jgi:AcrR family transcriptional regulator
MAGSKAGSTRGTGGRGGKPVRRGAAKARPAKSAAAAPARKTAVVKADLMAAAKPKRTGNYKGRPRTAADSRGQFPLPLPPLMPAPPKTSKGERTRQRILDAAERQIGERGFAEASITSITQEADVGQGTFYVYFRTKENVLRELVLRMGRRLRRALTLATAGAPDRLEVERRGLHAFFAFVRAQPNLYRVVAESQFVDPDAYRRYYEDFARSYRVALEAAEARGEISPGDAEVRAWLLMGLSDAAGRRFALWEPQAPFEAAAEAAFDFVAYGLSPRP